MNVKKIEAYLGFAIKAGKLTMGLNSIESLKKGVYCLLLDENAQKNSQKVARKLSAKFACPLMIIRDLGALVKRESCKIVAVKDSSLAGAILSEAGEQGISVEGAIG